MSYTSNSEFENNHVSYTNEIPPYDYYEGVHSLLTSDIWKWLLGYSEIEYDNDHKDIVSDLGDSPLYEETDYYHKSVNGTESVKYGPSSKEYFYENLTEDSFIKIAEFSKIKELNAAAFPTISALEDKFQVKLTGLKISTNNIFKKLPLKRVTSIDFMTEPGYVYLLNIGGDMYDKYCVFSKVENDREYRTLVKLGVKVKYEKYHTMDLNGVLLPEEDLFLHEIYRYFETLYPDDPDWVDLLTNNEVNDAITNAAAMVNYQPDNNFFELVAKNLEADENDAVKEAFKIKLRNLTNNAYRRKLYGSRYGYRMFGADIFENLLVYPIGTYIPIKPVKAAISYDGRAVTENNISNFDSSLFEIKLPPKTLYNRYVDQYDPHYYNKFRLIDWTGDTHKVAKSDNLTVYDINFFAVPGFEDYLFENIYTLSDYLEYCPGFILNKGDKNYVINGIETKGNYRVINIGDASTELVSSCEVGILNIPNSTGQQALEGLSSISGENFTTVLDLYLKKPDVSVRPLKIYPYPLINNAFVTEISDNLKIYPESVHLRKNPNINAAERIQILCEDGEVEPPLKEGDILRQGDYIYIENDGDPQLHVVQSYKRMVLSIEFDHIERYTYLTPNIVYDAAAYALVAENCDGGNVLLYGRIVNLKCSVATEKTAEQPYTCEFIVSAIPDVVPAEILSQFYIKNNREAFSNDYKYKLYRGYNKDTNVYSGLLVKKIYAYDGEQYVSTPQFSTGTITDINYGYWKSMPIYVEKSFIGSIYSQYKYDFDYNGNLFTTDEWKSAEGDLAITLNEALLQKQAPFDFLNKLISSKTSCTLSYFNNATTNITLESKVEIDITNGNNNVISFENDYARKMFKNLSVGDIVMGPGLPDVNEDIFITSVGDYQITVNVPLTKAGTFNLIYKCSLNAINEDKFDTVDDFEQRLSNIGEHEVMNPWIHGLYGSDNYPNVAGALIDGLSDIKYFKPYINSEGTVYFTDVIMPTIYGDKLEYFTKGDKNYKRIVKNQIIPSTIKYIGDVFVDVALNKLCTLPNRLGQTDNLIVVDWLDYLTDNALELSRASDKVQFGAHLLLETDSSGVFSQDELAVYTDPSVHATIQTFNWKSDAVPGFAQIGTGGKNTFIKFKSKRQQRAMELWGSQVWDDGHQIDSTKVLIQPTIQQSDDNKNNRQAELDLITAEIERVYNETYQKIYASLENSGKSEEEKKQEASHEANLAALDLEVRKNAVEGKPIGQGELRNRSIWDYKTDDNKNNYYTEITQPVAQINLGEYDVQLHYDGEQSDRKVDVTTIQANFYKQSFENIINDDRDNMKVAPGIIADSNFILNDRSSIEKLENVKAEGDPPSTLTKEVAEKESELFIKSSARIKDENDGPDKEVVYTYSCLGYWTPNVKNGKIDWPCDKSVLVKAHERGEIYYYIIESGATFVDLVLTEEDDIDIRSDKYNKINSFSEYSISFADQSILTVTPDSSNESGYRWSNKKINLVGLFGDLNGNALDSMYNVYPPYENTWLNVILHRALGAVTGFIPTSYTVGSGMTPFIGTYAFCPGYKGGYTNDDCKSTLSSITDYLEAFNRYYNDGADNSGRYTPRTGSVLTIDGDLVLNRDNHTGHFAEIASNIFVLSLVEKKDEDSDDVVKGIYDALNPGNNKHYGAFIAVVPEYDFGAQTITFDIVELAPNSFFVQNLKKDKDLVSSTEYDYFSTSDSLWQRFNDHITSKIALPRKMIAEGSYKLDFIIDPEFNGEVYAYSDYTKYLNGEIDEQDLTPIAKSITTSAIFYEEDKDIFYIQSQKLNEDYCTLISKYNLTILQLLLERNQDGTIKYSIGEDDEARTVLLLRIDKKERLDENGECVLDENGDQLYDPDDFFITSTGERLNYLYNQDTYDTELTRANGEPFEDGETKKIIGTKGESVIAIYEDTFQALTAEELSQVDIKYIKKPVDSELVANESNVEYKSFNIMTDLYENSEFFRAIINKSVENNDEETVDNDPNLDPSEYLLDKEAETYALIFERGVGKKVSGNFQVKLPVAGTQFESDPDEKANTVIVEKYVIPFNENHYYKNLKYLTCNYQLVKTQVPGDDIITETPTITKVEGEAFDISSLTLTDRLLKLTPVQLRPIERAGSKPTFFSSFTKIKGQLVSVNNADHTIKVTYDIGSLVFPEGRDDTADQMVTLASRSDFSEQLSKLLPAYSVYNKDTQDNDLIVDSDTDIDFSKGYTWHNEKIAAPQVVQAKVSSRFKTTETPTIEFKYFKNLLLIEADVSGDDPYTLSLKGNSIKAMGLLDSDDAIVGAVPLFTQSGEFAKTCAIYQITFTGTQLPLKVDYIYYDNGYVIGALNTRIYYEKVASLEGRTRVNLKQGVSLGNYSGYKVVDITYADNYFYITLGDSAGNRIIKRVIGDIDLAQDTDVTDMALASPIIWTETVYKDQNASEPYAKAGDSYIPTGDTIYDKSGSIVTSPQATGLAGPAAVDSGMVLVCDAYDADHKLIGEKGQSLFTASDIYSSSGVKLDKPFTYGTNAITVADWLSDTLNMASVKATVFDHDIIHGQVSIEHTDYMLNDSGETVPQTFDVYPEYSSIETNSAASPLFAASKSGYEAMLIGKTLFLKSPTATVSESKASGYEYDGGTTTFMHWKKVDLPVSFNKFRNSFKTVSDEEFYAGMTEVFKTIDEELSERNSAQNSDLISYIRGLISENFMVEGELITLNKFTSDHSEAVNSGSITGHTFELKGVSYSGGVATLGSSERAPYNITPDASVPANETYNMPHYALTYREMLLDFAEYVCGAADNTRLFTESAMKMYFEGDTLYIQTSNRDIVTISAENMTKRSDLENGKNWNLISISGEVTILGAPDENATYKIVYQDKEKYIEAPTVRHIQNFVDAYATYDAGSMKFLAGQLDSAKDIRSFLDARVAGMSNDEKSSYVKNLYAAEHYSYASPVLLVSTDNSSYIRVALPELKVSQSGAELVVGKDFGAYISSIKKIGSYVYAFVKADLGHSGIYSPLTKALRIMKNSDGEWSLSCPTTERPETSVYDMIWISTSDSGISSDDLETFANSSDFVASGKSKLGYNSSEPFGSFTYPSVMDTSLSNTNLSVVRAINGKVLLNGPLFMPSKTDMTFLLAVKTKKQVYDQSIYLNSENYSSYTLNGKFLVDSIVEVSSSRDADRMYNKREVMPTARRADGMTPEEYEKYALRDTEGYPSVAEDTYHIYYKYDVYGSDYYVKDLYNKDHNEIKLCNIDGDYFVQNNASTPVPVRYANSEKLLRIGASVSIAYNAPYAEYNSVAAASRNENARPLDEKLSNSLTSLATAVKEICLDVDNPYLIMSYSGALSGFDNTAISNYEKYIELNIYVPYIHASPVNSADNMLFNVAKTWDSETGRLKSGVIADLADGLPVSAIYIPIKGYGSTRDNTIDWDKKDNYKPWMVDPAAFEHIVDEAGKPVFTDLKNSAGKTVYLCKADGELIKDSQGDFVPVKVPKYLDIGSLVVGENGYEIERSYVKKNMTLGGLKNSRNSISYIEQIDVENNKFTLKEKLTLSEPDLNDGEKHVIMLTLLTVEHVSLSPNVMNNPEYFIEIKPYEKNIFGFDRICWNSKGYPRSPIKIGNNIFYSENNSKYEPNLFADPFGTPVYECDEYGYYIGFAKAKVSDNSQNGTRKTIEAKTVIDGAYKLIEKGRLDSELKDGDLSKFVTASHDLRFRPYTPKYNSCQDWFKDEFYLKGQEKNPYWQVIHIQADYNSNTMQFEQTSKLQEYVKIGSTMNLRDLPANESYVTVKKPTRVTTVKGMRFIEPNAPYLNCKYGLVDMILIPAERGTKYNPIYEEPHERTNSDIYVKYGISARVPWDEMGNYNHIFDTNMEALTGVHNYFCGSWSVNTLENFVDRTDKDKAITQIDELGIFDTEGHLMIYATFPAIEYRTDTQHVDFTIIVNNDKNIVKKADAASSIESE